MTFLAILDLNTGSTNGPMVFNYNSVTGVGAADVNGGITVGVKAAGTGTNQHTTYQDGMTGGHGDPVIATGHALRLS
jgi:hypothetical protein